MRKPRWLVSRLRGGAALGATRRTLREHLLHTVCEEARCPNRSECFGAGQATFLLMGNVCTRNCRFCAIASGVPCALDPDEPRRVAQAAKKMGLSFVVVTSVTRDDLPDGGAGHFAETIQRLRHHIPGVGVEVLVPDFGGDLASVDVVLEQKPVVFNHNVETIPRLYGTVRPQASFERSLGVLEHAARRGTSIVKSGFMVGLGEDDDEVFELMRFLRDAGVDVVTIGQYLQPTPKHLPVARFVPPETFEEYRRYGEGVLGLRRVIAGPLVRSSYRASQTARELSYLLR